MRFIFSFPDIGEGITEGKIVEWHVEKGKEVQPGDALVQMETDKVVTDIPSPKGGTVVAVYGREGDTIQVGDPLVELDIENTYGKDAQEFVEKAEEEMKVSSRSRAESVEEGNAGVVGTIEVAGNSAYLPASTEGITEGAGKEAGGERGERKKALATPVARAMAKNLGVNIDSVRGTGPAGRVTKRDIQEWISTRHTEGVDHGRAPSGGSRDAKEQIQQRSKSVDIPQIRKSIALHMVQSSHDTASMTVFDYADAGRLMEIRKRHRAAYETAGIKLTFLPFILSAVTASLKRHPYLNSEIDMDAGKIVLKNFYNIGIAVDTDDGLVVPVLRDTDRKSIAGLAEEIQRLSEKARERRLSFEEMKGGTFSVTNYGAIGGMYATPIINYPQAAILGIGRITEQPVVREGRVEPGLVLPLSLTADHRIVDGGEATRFLLDIIRFINEPMDIYVGLEERSNSDV